MRFLPRVGFLALLWALPALAQPAYELGELACLVPSQPTLPIAPAGGTPTAVALGSYCSSTAAVDSTTPGGKTARTLSQALAGRALGVSVMQSSGVVGTGSRVRMRGASGLLVPREPILVIDGARADGRQTSLGIDIGGQSPSRLDDIPLDDIERVETLRGPSASALYGTDAAGGVIVVTTKRGRSGEPRWSGYMEGGLANDVTSYPSNTATGPPTFGRDTCTRAQSAIGACTPGPLSQWNPIENASPFRTGARIAGGANVSGGTRHVSYFATGSASSDQGPLEPNDARRFSGRLNLDVHPLRSLRVALNGSYVEGRTTLPNGDVTQIAALFSGLMGNTADDPARRGYVNYDVATIASVVTQQHIERSLGSVAPEWTPLPWMTVRGIVAREILRRNDSRTLPMAAAFGDPTREGPFNFEGFGGRDMRTTIGTAATMAYSITPTLRGETVVGAERLTQSFRASDSVHHFFEDGTPSGFSLLRTWSERKTAGVYAAQQLTWGARTFGAGVRHDGGDDEQFQKSATYWSANAAWNVSAERFFRRTRAVSALALHAAYGVAGDTRPIASVLSSVPMLPPPVGPQPTVPDFAPERVSELELGVDLRSLHDRLRIDGTWYQQRSTGAYERGCCLGPFGFVDAGGWRTNGVELSIDATLLETLTSRWDARVLFATMSNTYDGTSNVGSRPLDFFPPLGNGRRRLVPGYPIAGVWGQPLSARDANADGIIDPTEITEAPDPVYLGSSIPTREAALATSLMVFRRVTLSAQLDYRGGFKVLNGTEQLRCELQTCDALYDPNASMADQTRAVEAFTDPGYQEDGDNLRLREVSIAWGLAPGWARRNGFDRIALTVAGRNLWTATKYSGLDPEVNALGQSSFGTTELFTLPLPRTLLVRLSIQH